MIAFTPVSASARSVFCARSPTTSSAPVGSATCTRRLRARAVCLPASSAWTTARPSVPVAPVTRTLAISAISRRVALLRGLLFEHSHHGGMLPVEDQVLAAHRVFAHDEDVLVEADAEQVARGITGQATTEAVLRIERIADEVGDAADGAPRPVAVDIVEELDEPRLLWLDRPLRHIRGRRRRTHIPAAVAVR